ncbi:hypothetical protein LMG31841_00273 [Paraburkholderia saeva]|uniref:Uncharacterized protein n=1 Tax=Paraburkholderia saeva TaxID=2777537 RepID=A0A9N8RRK8_9BURK|nr:hypothetical protein LMG31841_00273 [Paraburkholderia saeva]
MNMKFTTLASAAFLNLALAGCGHSEVDTVSSLYPRVAQRRLRIEVEMAFLHNRPQGLMMPTGLG